MYFFPLKHANTIIHFALKKIEIIYKKIIYLKIFKIIFSTHKESEKSSPKMNLNRTLIEFEPELERKLNRTDFLF